MNEKLQEPGPSPPQASSQLNLQRIEADVRNHPHVHEWIREVLLFDRVDSTNAVALQIGSAGMPGGVLVLAEAQNRGRGRLNRLWVSPKGVNLYLSLLLRPYQPVREFPLYSLATAVALVSAIRTGTGLTAVVKWPNDILLGDKKVAGILLEASKKGGKVPYLVIGIGINVNWDLNEIPQELSATSLKIALGHLVDRNRLINDILVQMAEQYRILDAGKKEQIINSLSEICITLGKKVRVETPSQGSHPRQIFEGVAEAILEDGQLLLSMADRSQRKILLGDITHLREVH